jgi:hypothetical protein
VIKRLQISTPSTELGPTTIEFSLPNIVQKHLKIQAACTNITQQTGHFIVFDLVLLNAPKLAWYLNTGL